MTFSRNEGSNDLARRQTHTGRLALTRIRLLGSCDADLDADAFQGWGADRGQGRRDGVADSLGFAAALWERGLVNWVRVCRGEV